MEEEKDEDETSSTRLCLLLSLLPEDLIINNILLKLPVRSVMRLRCVCKYFWSLTTSPSFANLHLDHAKTDQLINNHPSLILISYFDTDQTSIIFYNKWKVKMYSWTLKQLILTTTTTTTCCLSSLGDDNTNTVVAVEDVKIPCAYKSTWAPVTFQIWGSCNGLLCVVEAREYYEGYNCLPCIWNPCTKEFKRLPPPPMELDTKIISKRDGFGHQVTHGFGYDHTIDDYKVIIWMHWNSHRQGVLSESVIYVYTLGGGGGATKNSPSWRCAPYKPLGGKQALQRRRGLYFRGALHWVIHTCDHHHLEVNSGPYRKHIVSFDMETEAIRELAVPHPHGCSYYNKGDEDWVLQELRGCFCLLIYNTDHEKRIIDVWMMKDYLVNNGCWTHLLTIVAELPTPPQNHLISTFRFNPRTAWIPLRFCENGEILILENCKGLYMYDPNTKSTRSIIETKDIRQGDNFFFMETYIESLVSLKTVFSTGLL